MTVFQPLQHGLEHHLSDGCFTANGQVVYVGTRHLVDGWVAAVIRIDNIISETEAGWLGAHIRADLLTHMRFVNQEDIPPEAVDQEQGVPLGGVGWSVAVYVTLASSAEAIALKAFLTTYVGEALG